MWKWQERERKGKGKEKVIFDNAGKGREICGLGCVPDESKNEMRNKRD